jgi:hypothetical protein
MKPSFLYSKTCKHDFKSSRDLLDLPNHFQNSLMQNLKIEKWGKRIYIASSRLISHINYLQDVIMEMRNASN